ncbi:hypothetical protein ACP4OV_028640 [Aristida adscensionis]
MAQTRRLSPTALDPLIPLLPFLVSHSVQRSELSTAWPVPVGDEEPAVLQARQRRRRQWRAWEVAGAAAVAGRTRIRGGSEELWSADLSKLEIRGKFASGQHSRIYAGSSRYAGRKVAIKMVKQSEDGARPKHAMVAASKPVTTEDGARWG